MFTRPEEGYDIKLFRRYQPPRIVFKPEVLYAQQYIVANCKEEVAWLGLVKKRGDGSYLIEEVFLPTQGVRGAECEILASGYDAIAQELEGRGQIQRMWDDLKFWGHSHVMMSVGPSGDDQKSAIKRTTDAQDYYIRCICNKRGMMHVSFFDGVTGLAYENVEWEVDDGIDKEAVYARFRPLMETNVMPWDKAFPKPEKKVVSVAPAATPLLGHEIDPKNISAADKSVLRQILGDNWHDKLPNGQKRRRSRGVEVEMEQF